MTKNSHFENRTSTTVSFSEQTQKNISAFKSGKLTAKTTTIKKSDISLRNQLLLAILPIILIPLAIASVLVHRINQKNSIIDTIPKLQQQALLAGQVAKGFLEEELKLPEMLANNPLVINAARQGSQTVKANNLDRVPIEQIEKSFSATKLIQPNQEINDYLRKTAKIGQVAQLYFTDKHGFNVAYTIPPYDFVQSDEQWWQEGKSQQRWISAPDFDPSVRLFSLSLVRAIVDPQSGEFLGVVKSIVPASQFDRLTQYLELAKIDSSQIIQIIEGNTGRVIATVTEDGASSTRRVKGSEAIAALGGALVKVLQEPKLNLEQIMSEVQQQYSLSNLTFNRFNPETNENAPRAEFIYQDRYYTITTIPSINWIAVASVEHRQIVKADNQLIAPFALAALIWIVGTLVILWLLARQLSAPLLDLANIFEQTQAGNLDVVAQPAGNRETRTLARSFNTLVLKVKSVLQQQEKYDAIQQETIELLGDVERLSSGDLTVQANIGDTPVSTLAGFFNLTIESLRDIVIQVRQAAAKVNSSIVDNKSKNCQLADRILQQSDQINQILNKVEAISLSIHKIAEKANRAVEIHNTASSIANTEKVNIEQTVAKIYQLRSNISTTVNKVKQLGEYSQAIIHAITPISEIATQTNVLAINAKIEAGRIKAQNHSLTTVAEEVGQLATSLATVKTELEQIVDKIQQRITEVMECLEREISQIVVGTRTAEKAQNNVEQILGLSDQLEQLMRSIAEETVSQANISQSVTQLSQEAMLVFDRTVDSASAVSSGWQETLILAQQLQVSVETFKIGDEA